MGSQGLAKKQQATVPVKSGVERALEKLTPREHRFCQNVVAGMNHKEAVIAGGGRPSRAEAIASTMMRKRVVQDALYYMKAEKFDRLNISEDDWYKAVATVAFLEPHMLDGRFTPKDKLTALKMLGESKTLKTLSKINTTNLNVSLTSLIRKADDRISKVPITIEAVKVSD